MKNKIAIALNHYGLRNLILKKAESYSLETLAPRAIGRKGKNLHRFIFVASKLYDGTYQLAFLVDKTTYPENCDEQAAVGSKLSKYKRYR